MKWQLHQPGMLSLLRELLGRMGLRGRWIYVTDGGHYENLGLVEALRRGATEIVVFDASGDAPHSWTAFGQAVETARADLGVQVDLDPTPMAPTGDGGRAPTLVVQGSCSYPNGAQATLVLCKLAMPMEVAGVLGRRGLGEEPRDFPHDSTAQQLYGDREFEAYRRLGELGGERALALLVGDDQAADEAAAQEKAQDRAKESARQKASVKPRAAKKIDLTDKADSASTVTTPAMPAQSTAGQESQQTPTHAS